MSDTREQLLQDIRQAKALDEMRRVMERSRRWMDEHPGDTRIASAAEGLYMLYIAALEEQRGWQRNMV